MYNIYTSVIIVAMCVTNLLAPFISTKREYRLIVGIQLSGIVVIYFNFSLLTVIIAMSVRFRYNTVKS